MPDNCGPRGESKIGLKRNKKQMYKILIEGGRGKGRRHLIPDQDRIKKTRESLVAARKVGFLKCTLTDV